MEGMAIIIYIICYLFCRVTLAALWGKDARAAGMDAGRQRRLDRHPREKGWLGPGQ